MGSKSLDPEAEVYFDRASYKVALDRMHKVEKELADLKKLVREFDAVFKAHSICFPKVGEPWNIG